MGHQGMEFKAMSNDERIIDLEMKLAHVEQQFEDLNAVVLEQSEIIRALKAKLSLAESKIEDLANAKEDGENLSSIEIAAREKPPHY